MRGLLRRDLENASRNLASWRKQAAEKDTPFHRDRIAYWVAEIDRLLDRWLDGDESGPSHL